MSESIQLVQALRSYPGDTPENNCDCLHGTCLSQAYTDWHAEKKHLFVVRRLKYVEGGANPLLSSATSTKYDDIGAFGTKSKCPLNIDYARTLAQPSVFGLGERTVFDEKVRKSVEIKLHDEPATRKENTDKKERAEEEDQAPRIAREIYVEAVRTASFLFGKRIQVIPDKLVLYAPTDHFALHKDSMVDASHLGTVVADLFTKVGVPSNDMEGRWGWDEQHRFAAASLVLCPHGQTPYTVPNTSKIVPATFTAFFIDVPHKVEPASGGFDKQIDRLSVTFKVFQADTANPDARQSAYDSAQFFDGERPFSHRDSDESRSHYGDDDYADSNSVYDTTDPCASSSENEDNEFENEDELCTEDVHKDDMSADRFFDHFSPEKGHVYVFGCYHLVPEAALRAEEGINSMRGRDKEIAQEFIKRGYSVTPVLVKITTHTGYEETRVRRYVHICDLPAEFIKRRSRVHFVPQMQTFDAFTISKRSVEVDHIGNQAGNVSEFRYVCAGLLVRELVDQQAKLICFMPVSFVLFIFCVYKTFLCLFQMVKLLLTESVH